MIINSTLASAATIGAWTVSNPMAVGASILYDGSKGAMTSSILITPNTSQVAKVLRGGVAGYALTLAVEQLLGAVDWILDPINNQIRYKDKDLNNPYPYIFSLYGANERSLSIDDVCIKAFKKGGWAGTNVPPLPKGFGCYLVGNRIIAHNQYGELGEVGYVIWNLQKTLPLETVAQKVIENAESDNLDAQFAVLAAANNILSEAENDDAKAKPIEDELENNAKCPSGIVRNGSCWICDKSQFMPITRATRDAKTATRGKSCKNVTDTAIKTANAALFRNLINARIQENACWSPPDPNHAKALLDAQNALSLCEN